MVRLSSAPVCMVVVACGAAMPPVDPVREASSEIAAPAQIDWQWDGEVDPDRDTPSATDGALVCRLRYDDDARTTRLECESNGGSLWHRDEEQSFENRAFLLLHEDVLYVARFPRLSTGCTLYAFEASSGRTLWTARPDALGPVIHSQYINAVQLRIVEGRWLAVFGAEGAGRYIEAFDPGSGARVYRRLVEGTAGASM